MSDEVFRDAEAWLEARGVERRPLTGPEADAGGDTDTDRTGPDEPEVTIDLTEGARPLHEPPSADAGDDRAEVSAAEARRIATEAPLPDEPVAPEAIDVDPASPVRPPLDDAVAAAVATIRRSTSAAPASEQRVARKLRERGVPEAVVTQALRRAREERLVDDDALAAALVAEWREKGHASRRIRDDLRRRELPEDVVDRATAQLDHQDESAAAFGIARDRADRMSHVEPETAYRRVCSFLERRGYPAAIARKAARDAVFDQRDSERTASR